MEGVHHASEFLKIRGQLSDTKPMPHHLELFESYIPLDLLNWQNALLAFGVMFLIINFRYFLMVSLFWFGFYRNPSAQKRANQIYDLLPGKADQLREIKWSFLSSFIFAFAGLLMGILWQSGATQIYLSFDQYGWWYLPVSAVLLAVIHDAYFYWTHYWLHIPQVYKKYHAVHHASLKPSPWASFSFHPVESVINAVAIPLIILILPLHPVVILWHLTLMTLTAITNHLGFEVLPKGAADHWLGKYLVSGVHHTQHHRYFRYNYGLFFTWWDHWFKTEHPQYVDQFNQVKGAK